MERFIVPVYGIGKRVTKIMTNFTHILLLLNEIAIFSAIYKYFIAVFVINISAPNTNTEKKLPISSRYRFCLGFCIAYFIRITTDTFINIIADKR